MIVLNRLILTGAIRTSSIDNFAHVAGSAKAAFVAVAVDAAAFNQLVVELLFKSCGGLSLSLSFIDERDFCGLYLRGGDTPQSRLPAAWAK
jgi:hypothetical protein